MAIRYCTKCGKEVTEGKRFCSGCGQAMPMAAVPQAEAIAKTEPAVAVCAQCGAALVPGKRFCKQCGHAADASASTPAALPFAEAEAAPHPASTPESAPAFSETPVTKAAWPPPVPSEATPAPQTKPAGNSKAMMGLAAGLAVAVLAAAGGGWAWYAHTHRAASSTSQGAPAQSSAAQSAAATGTPSGAGVASTTAQPSKPSAGTSAASVSKPPAPDYKQADTTSKDADSSSQPQRSNLSNDENPTAPTPVFYPPKPQPTMQFEGEPAQARSGVLRYQGPPIAYFGTVVFDNLPKARLRLTFDHSAWQLVLKRNPDGTKKAILTSIKPGLQTRCDLGWEIVD